MERRRLRRRIVLAALALVLAPPGLFLAYVAWTSNFGTIVPRRAFRSAQMTSADLSRTLKTYQIKTVLNLRGPNPDERWYRAEREATTRGGATQVDISLSSTEWMSRAQLHTLIRVFDTCEYPLLIHCEHGSERTGLASAFWEFLRPGATLRDAEQQFSIRHLFLRRGGKMMAEHVDQYEAWLRTHGWGHSPARFRQWADEGFTPRWPTREMWPYDPKPLLVVTRPVGAEQVLPIAGAEPGSTRR